MLDKELDFTDLEKEAAKQKSIYEMTFLEYYTLIKKYFYDDFGVWSYGGSNVKVFSIPVSKITIQSWSGDLHLNTYFADEIENKVGNGTGWLYFTEQEGRTFIENFNNNNNTKLGFQYWEYLCVVKHYKSIDFQNALFEMCKFEHFIMIKYALEVFNKKVPNNVLQEYKRYLKPKKTVAKKSIIEKAKKTVAKKPIIEKTKKTVAKIDKKIMAKRKEKELYLMNFDEVLQTHGASVFRLSVGNAKKLMRIGKENNKWTSSARVSGLGSKSYDVTVHFKDSAFFEEKIGKKPNRTETKLQNEGRSSYSVKSMHQKAIQDAVKEGKTVPNEILKLYPELKLEPTYENSTFKKTVEKAKKTVAKKEKSLTTEAKELQDFITKKEKSLAIEMKELQDAAKARLKSKISTSSKPIRKSSKDIRDGRIQSDWLKNGREASYWRKNPPRLILNPSDKNFRQGINLPIEYIKNANDFDLLKKMFGIKGFEFGKWTNYEDRYNYLVGLSAALYDLAEILAIPKTKIGLNLGIAFGARGTSKALAHYEPYNHVINLTRFKGVERFDNSKYQKVFLQSGGLRSLTHEWGHAFDYYVGGGANSSISQGRVSLHKIPSFSELGLVGLMKNLFLKLCYKDKEGKEMTDFGKRIVDTRSEYLMRCNEIFARSFEVYVYLKMKNKGYFNVFLAKGKYDENNKLTNKFSKAIYPTEQEMRSVMKEFDLLISKMKQKL